MMLVALVESCRISTLRISDAEVVSMIAPSPDWFVGVHGLLLVDADGEWVDSLTIELLASDSGTDDGPNFTSPNDDSDPAVPIFQNADTPPFALKEGVEGDVGPVATFLIERRP